MWGVGEDLHSACCAQSIFSADCKRACSNNCRLRDDVRESRVGSLTDRMSYDMRTYCVVRKEEPLTPLYAPRYAKRSHVVGPLRAAEAEAAHCPHPTCIPLLMQMHCKHKGQHDMD